MKRKIIINLLLCIMLLFSCNEEKLEYIGQEIIDGKISATERGVSGGYNIKSSAKIWVQDEKTTKEVEIPFTYENRWKINDSCLLIILKYKENEK